MTTEAYSRPVHAMKDTIIVIVYIVQFYLVSIGPMFLIFNASL
jgi:hypothetical protein